MAPIIIPTEQHRPCHKLTNKGLYCAAAVDERGDSKPYLHPPEEDEDDADMTLDHLDGPSAGFCVPPRAGAAESLEDPFATFRSHLADIGCFSFIISSFPCT